MVCGDKVPFPLLASCSVSSLKRTVDCFVVMVLFLVTITLIYRPARTFHRLRKTHPEELSYGRIFLSVGDLTDDGFVFTKTQTKEKYISYEPPVGSWSKQLLAFENAVIFAKLLNRTLLVHPLASEMESKRLKKLVQKHLEPDSRIYDLIDKKYTVPVSSVIDLNILSKLIRIRHIRGTHRQFLQEFENSTWYDVCHKESLGFWVDFIPSPKNFQAWSVLGAQQFTTVASAVPGIEPICDQELEMMDDPQKPNPFIRGILTELAIVDEDVIYFRGGSLAMTNIRFLSKQRTGLVQKWASDYIRFTPYLQSKISGIVGRIKKPYNAVLIPEDDHLEVINNAINFRLREMRKRNFLNMTNRLYVITKWDNSTLLEPFRKHGYELYFTKEIVPPGISPQLKQDVANLLGQLICKYARLFAGPADSYLIQRARVHEARTKDGLLIDHVTVRWAGHTIGRKYQIEATRGTDLGGTNLTNAAHRLACVTCKFTQRRLKSEMCQLLMNDCLKRHITL